jgi:SAM-dependent methyltransferase
VAAVDVYDERITREGFDFIQVSDTDLPFHDRAFDLAVSNHVIEHVGARAAQMHHLRELRRVVRDDGWVYLAVPNRWRLIEAHYRVPFLSWLPESWRSPYLRMSSAGEVYDCYPPGPIEVRRMSRDAGFCARSVTAEAVIATVELEVAARLGAAARKIPPSLLSAATPFMPTLIFLLRPA